MPNSARGAPEEMNQTYGSNKFAAQLSQRKSRGKPQGQSVEPPNMTGNNSINGVAPHGYKKGGPLVQSPNLNTTYNGNNISLRDQLYSVKNSMTNKIQFSQANLPSRGAALQSPRPIGASS